jgi:hypothetical protein
MPINHRLVVSVSIATGIGLATLATAVACGGSSPAARPATASAAPSVTAAPSQHHQQKISQTTLDNVVKCMKSQGVAFPRTDVMAKDVKDAFRALPVAGRQKVVAACGSLLPAEIRQVVEQRMAQKPGGPSEGP